MFRFFIFLYTFLLCILFSKLVYSSTPSSDYLISNIAMAFNDYDTAIKYYSKEEYSNSNIIDLNKKLVAYIIANDLQKSSFIAKKIIDQDKYNQEAWLVYLTYAKIKNNLEIFNEFELINTKEKFQLLNYLFYFDNKIKKSNENIAYSFLETIQSSDINNIRHNNNIEYYLFYLSLTLNLNPKFNEALYFKAQILQELEYYEDAEKFYNLIENNHPLFLDAQKNIVINKNKIGKFEDAIKYLTKLINLNVNQRPYLILLADLHRISKKYNNAIKYYSDLLNDNFIQDDQLWRILYKRGICYERSNRWNKAENDLIQSLKANPNQPQVLNYLAYGWLERNVLIDKSLEMLERATKAYPDSFYILDSLAWAYYKKKNFLKAAEVMEKVLILAPAEAISLDHLGDIYFALGRKREAYFMWIQAQDLADPEDNISESVKLKIDKFNE